MNRTSRSAFGSLRTTSVVLGVAVLAALESPLAAQTPFTLDDISFLAGCWAGHMGSLDMLEQWSAPEGGMILGSTRYLREGRVVDWEFGMLVGDDEGVTLWPYPRGERSADGFPLVRTEGEYVFENLEHDFPVRIVYVRDGPDGLTPRIEGRDGEARGWSLRRVTCPGSR